LVDGFTAEVLFGESTVSSHLVESGSESRPSDRVATCHHKSLRNAIDDSEVAVVKVDGKSLHELLLVGRP